jgi:uncharacterized membrane protein (DUF2068 family)
MVVAGVALYVAQAAGATADLHQYAALVWNHVVRAWSLVAARLFFQVTAPTHIHLVIAAALLDGALSLFEGWALHRRYRWAPWLIVCATGSLLPFEVVELSRGVRAGRLLVFGINLAAVLYLARSARRGHEQRR